jgi:hypothetical protein
MPDTEVLPFSEILRDDLRIPFACDGALPSLSLLTVALDGDGGMPPATGNLELPALIGDNIEAVPWREGGRVDEPEEVVVVGNGSLVEETDFDKDAFVDLATDCAVWFLASVSPLRIP